MSKDIAISSVELASQQIDILHQAVFNYSDVLTRHSIEFMHVGYYLQIGRPASTQGWILHISVIRSQVAELLDTVLPTLISFNASFKIVEDKETARGVLDGNLSHFQVGKVISIYPETEKIAVDLAKQLIDLTIPFKGPKVLTDAYLGGTIYTRYGAFIPILIPNVDGQQERYIHSSTGSLIRDQYTMPFKIPAGINWPFNEITYLPSDILPKKDLNSIYRPVITLKTDTKGNVYKGVYLKKLLLPATCVIKQGKKNMWSDDAGRDMIERLVWQNELHNRLSDIIPIPRALDFFIEDEDAYLVIEYISGPNLLDEFFFLNKDCTSWEALSWINKKKILAYLLQVIDIVSKTHTENILHRDLTPVNFLVSKKKKLFLIDNELAFDLKKGIPHPAFEAGTHGFMSPQQAIMKTPAISDDIYSLGALLLTILTGLSPLQINVRNPKKLPKTLSLLLPTTTLNDTISACLSSNPHKRPSISQINQVVVDYSHHLQIHPIEQTKNIEVNSPGLSDIIDQAISGLVSQRVAMQDDLWYSRVSATAGLSGNESSEFSKSVGIFEGIAGVLYFLSLAHKAGFSIEKCKIQFNKGWEYVENKCLQSPSELSPGLYGGAAGIAMALSKAIDTGLKQGSQLDRSVIYDCLSTKTDYLDIATGIAGQGLALLQCRSYIGNDNFAKLLSNFTRAILEKIDKKSSWINITEESGQSYNALSFSHGNTGVCYFLMECISYNDSSNLQKTIRMVLTSLINQAKKVLLKYKKMGCRSLLNEDARIFDGVQGLVLVFAKAYSLYKNPIYKTMVERLLYMFPSSIVHGNFNQYTGLSGLGELYLYVHEMCPNKEWLKRAGWISRLLIECRIDAENDTTYWSAGPNIATADFMTGNSGIIHFLMYFLNREKLTYRLLG